MNKAATVNRNRHAYLDGHITELLPKALPPHTTSLALFLLGILPFAHIFTELEEAWDDLETRKYDSGRSEVVRRALTTEAVRELRKDLNRAELIQKDVRDLKASVRKNPRYKVRFSREHGAWSTAKSYAMGFSRECDADEDAQEDAFSRTFFAWDLCRWVKAAADRPHLLIAHVYVWYMAVLSGGRYLKRTLEAVPPGFWNHQDPNDNSGFRFLGGSLELKERLRNQLTVWDEMMTEKERAEIVDETEKVYEMTIELVQKMEAHFEDVRSEESEQAAGREKHENADGRDQAREAFCRTAHLSQDAAVPWMGPSLQSNMRWVTRGLIAAACLWCMWLWLSA